MTAYTFNPMVMMFVMSLVHTGVVATMVALPPGFVPGKPAAVPGYRLARQWGLGVLALAGIILADAGTGWFWGGWSLADWRFQGPSVALLILVGIIYIAAFLREASILDVAFVASAAGAYAVIVHWWVALEVMMADRLASGVIGWLVIAGLAAGAIAAAKVRVLRAGGGDSRRRLELLAGRAWDRTATVNRVFSRKAIVMTWALATLQAILAFNGFSLLAWW